MANYYATANLASQTGETADVNVNTFAFIGPDVFTPTEGNFINVTIKAFYDTLRLAGAICGRATTGHVVKIYSATSFTPNYPIDESSFALAGTVPAIELPAEVTLAISYANDSASIVPRARRRGRIYIGAHAEAQNAAGRPSTTIVSALAGAYEVYCETLNADPDFQACVWSRTNASLYPIERCWVDNEWDTMRSRGGKSTSRDTRVIAQ